MDCRVFRREDSAFRAFRPAMTVWEGRSPQRKHRLAACGRAATPVKIFL